MKSSLNPILITLAAIGTILAMPVLLPFVAIGESRRKKRLLTCVSTYACDECEQMLGAASVDLSTEEWREHMQELRVKHPGVRFRLVRPHDAICPSCDAQYRYVEERGELVRVWFPDASRTIDEQRRSLPDSPTKRALREAVVRPPRRYDTRWLLAYDLSPNVLFDPKTGSYGIVGDNNQVVIVSDIGGVVSALAS